MFSLSPRYQPLPAKSPDVSHGGECADEAGDDSERAVTPSAGELSLWPLIVCLLCTLLNVVLYHYQASAPVALTPASVTGREVFQLRRPSQYIRLDEIVRPSPPVHRQFENYPIVVVQVDSVNQDRVIDDHSFGHMVNSGNILPLEKRVYISKTVSTIVQFRAIDYGMEKCELKVRMHPDSMTQISPVPFELEVFRLNSTIPLDRRVITHKTRPPRISKVASIQADAQMNTTWHRIFECESDTVLTFELVCKPNIEETDCRLEWLQTNYHPLSAVLITQHATV